MWPWFLTFWQINQKEFFSTSSQHADPWCHNYLLARIMVIAVDITRYCFTPRWERRKLLKSPFQVVLDPFSNFRSCYNFWEQKLIFQLFKYFWKSKNHFFKKKFFFHRSIPTIECIPASLPCYLLLYYTHSQWHSYYFWWKEPHSFKR